MGARAARPPPPGPAGAPRGREEPGAPHRPGPGPVVAADGEPVGEHAVAALREHRLGVELHGLDRQGAVAHRHDDAVVGGGADLELVGHGGGVDGQRVVPGDGQRIGQAREAASAVMGDDARLAVAQLRSAGDGGAEGDGHGLQAEADAEDRQVGAGAPDDVDADAGVLGGAGAGREEDAVEALAPVVPAEPRVVVAPDVDLCAELGQILDDVVDERVVVVDDEDPGHARSLGRTPTGDAPLPRTSRPTRARPGAPGQTAHECPGAVP